MKVSALISKLQAVPEDAEILLESMDCDMLFEPMLVTNEDLKFIGPEVWTLRCEDALCCQTCGAPLSGPNNAVPAEDTSYCQECVDK